MNETVVAQGLFTEAERQDLEDTGFVAWKLIEVDPSEKLMRAIYGPTTKVYLREVPEDFTPFESGRE